MPARSSIKWRLFRAMAAVIALLLGAVALALVGMADAKQRFHHIVEHDQAAILAATEMYAHGLRMEQALRNVVLDPGNRRAYENHADAGRGFQDAHAAAQALADAAVALLNSEETPLWRDLRAQLLDLRRDLVGEVGRTRAGIETESERTLALAVAALVLAAVASLSTAADGFSATAQGLSRSAREQAERLFGRVEQLSVEVVGLLDAAARQT